MTVDQNILSQLDRSTSFRLIVGRNLLETTALVYGSTEPGFEFSVAKK
jgi:hypothetical protein